MGFYDIQNFFHEQICGNDEEVIRNIFRKATNLVKDDPDEDMKKAMEEYRDLNQNLEENIELGITITRNGIVSLMVYSESMIARIYQRAGNSVFEDQHKDEYLEDCIDMVQFKGKYFELWINCNSQELRSRMRRVFKGKVKASSEARTGIAVYRIPLRIIK